MEREKRVSLADIAKAAKVSRVAVSLALRGIPRTSPKTRERILRIARELGYTPDPRLTAWLSQARRSQIREPVPIAWINLSRDPNAWRSRSYLIPYFEGASAQCEKHGYRLEEIWAREKGMTHRRLSKVLFSRGIQGVIIAPPHDLHGLGHLRLDWKHFACVSFEKAILAPRIQRVAQDQYLNLMLALKLLRRFRYRRIGVCLSEQGDRRSSHACRAAVSYFQSTIPRAERIPLLLHIHPGAIAGPEFSQWLHRHRPDVIVGQHSELINWLASEGLKVPEEIGVFHMAVEDDCADWSGIWARKREIGAMAADIVMSRLQNNELGVPYVRADTLIPGHWHPGKTLLVPKP